MWSFNKSKIVDCRPNVVKNTCHGRHAPNYNNNIVFSLTCPAITADASTTTAATAAAAGSVFFITYNNINNNIMYNVHDARCALLHGTCTTTPSTAAAAACKWGIKNVINLSDVWCRNAKNAMPKIFAESKVYIRKRWCKDATIQPSIMAIQQDRYLCNIYVQCVSVFNICETIPTFSNGQ